MINCIIFIKKRTGRHSWTCTYTWMYVHINPDTHNPTQHPNTDFLYRPITMKKLFQTFNKITCKSPSYIDVHVLKILLSFLKFKNKLNLR